MRSSLLLSPIASLILVILTSACSDQFEQQAELSREQGYARMSVAGDGLPHFRSKLMDPVWPDTLGAEKRYLDLAQVKKLDMKDQRGNPVSENLFKNKPTFVVFFFASCSTFCPTLLKFLQRVEKRVGKESFGKDVQYVAVSVDPEKDTPSVLQKFAQLWLGAGEQNQKNWYLLTGKRTQLNYLADEVFSVDAFKQAKKARTVHTERIFLIDREGYVRWVYNGTKVDLPQKAAHALAQLNQKNSLASQ